MEFGHTLNIVGNLIWKSPWWWVGFNEGDLKIFRPEVWNFEILNFEEFFPVDIQLDYKRWLYNEKLFGWPVHTWASGTVYTTQDLKSPSVSALFHLHLKQGVCHTVALPFTWKSILMQKKNYGNSNIPPCKNIIFKKSSKRNQNPSRYYNSTTNCKFQHKPKYHLSKICI